MHGHGWPLFTDHASHNNGLAGKDTGRFTITRHDADRGKFATPSLRNVARTASYMHDGRFGTIEEVVATTARASSAQPRSMRISRSTPMAGCISAPKISTRSWRF